MARLAEAGGTPFTVIILSEEKQARRELAEASPKLAALAQEAAVPPTDPKGRRTLLRGAGDADGVLPYARSVAPDGRLCASWRGILSGEPIRALLAACK